jgi:hypothetical protein
MVNYKITTGINISFGCRKKLTTGVILCNTIFSVVILYSYKIYDCKSFIGRKFRSVTIRFGTENANLNEVLKHGRIEI